MTVCQVRRGRDAYSPPPSPLQNVSMSEIAQYQGPVQKPFLIS